MESSETYLKRIRAEDRKKDMSYEENVAIKTDEILKECGVTVIRKNDLDSQNSGIDFIIDDPREMMLVDEKAAVSAYNRNLRTYTIETTNVCNPDESGWFNNKIAKNTHYLFVWPRSNDEKLKDIWRWEGMLIEKAILKSVFELMGFSKVELEEIAKGARYTTKKGARYTIIHYGKKKGEAIKVFYNANHVEKNVNVQFPKEWLSHFASRHIIWERENGIVLNQFYRPEIPYFVQNACAKIRRAKRVKPNACIQSITRAKDSENI